MDQPLYDHQLDAVPPPLGFSVPADTGLGLKSSAKGESAEAGTFEAWVTGLSLGALAGYSLLVGIAIVSPFLLLSSRTRVVGAALLIVQVFVGLLFLGLKRKPASTEPQKGYKSALITPSRSNFQRLSSKIAQVFVFITYIISTMSTILGVDTVFVSTFLESHAQVSWLFVAAPMTTAVLSLCAMLRFMPWKKSLAFAVLTAFWLSVFQFGIACIVSMILISFGFVDANFAAGVSAGSFFLSVPMALSFGIFFYRAKKVLNSCD